MRPETKLNRLDEVCFENRGLLQEGLKRKKHDS